MRFDTADMKIIDLLSKNSKIKIKDVASALKIKNATAAYHLSKLAPCYVKKVILDYYKMGNISYKLFIKLRDFEDSIKNEIETFSINFENVNKISHLTGNFDIMIDFNARNNNNFTIFYSQLIEKFGKKIIFREITIPYYSLMITGNIFGTCMSRPVLAKSLERVDIKPQEIKLLNKLNKIKKIRELSNESGLDEKTVRKYLRNLEKRKIILGYSVNLDLTSGGYEKYYVRFNVAEPSKLIKHLGKIKGITSIEKSISKWDVEVKMIAKSHINISKIIKDAKKSVPSLSKYDVLYIEKETIK